MGHEVYTTLPREASSYQMHVLLNASNFHKDDTTLKTKTLHYTATDESEIQKSGVFQPYRQTDRHTHTHTHTHTHIHTHNNASMRIDAYTHEYN